MSNLRIETYWLHPNADKFVKDKQEYKGQGLDLRKCKKLNVIFDEPQKIRNGYWYCQECGDLMEPDKDTGLSFIRQTIKLNNGKTISIAVAACESCWW